MDKNPLTYYHILHMKSIEQEIVTTYAEAVDEVKGKLMENVNDSSVQFIVDRLRRKAKVSVK